MLLFFSDYSSHLSVILVAGKWRQWWGNETSSKLFNCFVTALKLHLNSFLLHSIFHSYKPRIWCWYIFICIYVIYICICIYLFMCIFILMKCRMNLHKVQASSIFFFSFFLFRSEFHGRWRCMFIDIYEHVEKAREELAHGCSERSPSGPVYVASNYPESGKCKFYEPAKRVKNKIFISHKWLK